MSLTAQRFTKGKPVLPERLFVDEHFENVAADKAEAEEMFWRDEWNDSCPPRFEPLFDDEIDFDRDFERTAYFYEPSNSFDEYDDRLEDTFADRYEYMDL